MLEQQGMVLKEIFRLDVRVKFFICGDEALNKLSQDVDTPSLEVSHPWWAHWVSSLILWVALLSVVAGGCN